MIHWEYLLSALVFSGAGLVILFLAFFILEKLTPENLWKEIVEHKNLAVAVLIGMFILGMSHIIASSIRG
jgi:putative membrane protein